MAEQNSAENKQLANLHIGFEDLKGEVAEVNRLLSTLGKNIDFDMTKIVEKQVKTSLSSLISEVKRMSEQSMKASGEASKGFSSIGTEIEKVVKVTRTLDQEGNVIKTIVQGLDQVGNAVREVTNAEGELTRTISERGQYAKDEALQKETKKAIQHYANLLAEINKVKVAMAGVASGSEEWNVYASKLGHLTDEAEKAKQAISSLAGDPAVAKDLFEQAEAMDQVKDSAEKYRLAVAKSQDSFVRRQNAEEIKNINDLTKNYISTLHELNGLEKKRLEDDGSSAEYTDELNRQIRVLESQIRDYDRILASLDDSEEKEEAIVRTQKEREKMADQISLTEAEIAKTLEEQRRQQSPLAKIQEQAVRSLTHLITMYASEAVSKFWKSGWEYAQKYYDLLNEIRIVTGQTEAEAQKMGATYRKMAKDMSTSSTEIASAAVEFWRQGLDDSEVNSRQVNTTQYAKISGLQFKEAAELVTAATNSMDLDAQRVVDVFSYLGDASASGADEIGKAMQKAGATAQEAGLSFEWLGAYIATISERTRQAPEVIGTSLNSIMSRLQSIKQMGYNEEDETKINDISKALKNIDVAIMDTNGNWRDMSDIFMDIAVKWNDLDDKTRSYIATTMAGTRQKNYFLSLMDDLKNVTGATGEASRAMELYEGALNAAGSAAEKYAIYQESVTAAHDRMKASWDQIYSLFSSDVLKGFYNTIGKLGDTIYSWFTSPAFDHSGIVSALQSESDAIKAAIDQYEELETAEVDSMEKEKQQTKIVETLAGKYRPLADILKETGGGFKTGKEAVEAMTEALRENNEEINKYARYDWEQKIVDLSALKAGKEAIDAQKDDELIRSIFEAAASISGKNIGTANAKDFIGMANTIEQKINGKFFGIPVKPSFGGDDAIYDLFFPDGKANDEVFKAWNDFIEKWRGNILEGYNEASKSTADSAIKAQEKNAKEKVKEYIGYFKTFDYYNQFGDAFKGEFDKYILDAVMNSLTEEDLVGDETELDIKMRQLAESARDAFLETFSSIEDELNSLMEEYENADNPVDKMLAGMNVNNHISWLNQTYGLKIPFIDQLKEDIPEAEAALDEFYVKLKKSQEESQIELRHDAGWADEISHMMEVLESADPERITSMIDAFKDEGNSAWFEQMKKDLPWLEESLFALYDEAGTQTIDEEHIRKAQEIWKTGFIEANESAQSFKETIESIKADNLASAAEESGFADQLAKIAEMATMGAGWADAEWNNEGFANYLKELNDEGLLDSITEKYDFLKDFIAEHIVQMEDGRWVIQAQAEDWAALSEAILHATDSMWQYAEAQETEIDSESGINLMKGLSDAYDTSGIDGYHEAFEKLTDEEKEWIRTNSKAHKQMEKAWKKGEDGIEDSTKAMKKFNREMKKMELDDLAESGEIWQEVADIADDSVDTEEELIQAYGEFQSKLDEIVEAQGDLNFAMSSTDKSTEDYASAISNLESVCGFAIDSEEDLALAQLYLASQMDTATMSSAALLNYLMGISGSTFNAATWEAELAALAASGDSAAICMQNLIANIRAIDGARINYANGVFNVSGLGSAAIRRSGSSGGGRSSGGGSGGGSSAGNEMSEIEKMLDLMEQIQDIRKHQMDMIATTRDYYENQGYYTTAIKHYEDERDALEENSKVLEENIKKIEALLPAKQKEVAAMSTSDKKYEQAASDLKALQEAHQNYSKELLENKNSIAEFNDAISDMQKEIRDMEIELRETILEAIEDREELNERMLQGRIDVENEILDVIKARYEKERDLAIKTAEAKIEALEAESEALDEQLQKRKEAAEAEDKQLKLAQLQAQLARISADPTRRKEELELRKQIQELRDEMAWDLAEQEVEAQQESIDQQITSLEDYIEQVEDYYEDLFEHPQKLFEELKAIMAKTDEEILEFLKQNNEEYANSTEATQTDMVNSWNEMLMDMHGNIKTYWDEVEEIIAGGDEAIIEFLKENSADYKAAGKLQAEAYVDEWMEQLEALRKAYKDVYEEAKSYDYSVVKPSTGSSSSGSSGSSSSGSRYITQDMLTKETTYDQYDQPETYWYYQGRRVVMKMAPDGQMHWAYYGTETFPKYAKGGIADFTGPAWLDGTKQNPERILSPYQTKLFEDMIATLHQIKITAPQMPTGIFDGATNATQAITFGDIILNVDQLAEDADYTEIVKRLMEEINDRMTQGLAVGGIRITR